MKVNKDLIKLHAAYVAELGITGREDAGLLTLAHVVSDLEGTILSVFSAVDGENVTSIAEVLAEIRSQRTEI